MVVIVPFGLKSRNSSCQH